MFLKKLNAAGKLALVVVAVFLLGGLGLLGRQIYYEVGGLDTLAEITAVPTYTPEPTITHTPAPPTATATPEGWERTSDPLVDREYLSPPPSVEEEIREAFWKTVAPEVLKMSGEDIAGMNPEELAEMREKDLAEMLELCTDEGWTGRDWDARSSTSIVPQEHWGPKNPVRCDDYRTCTFTRAKTGKSTHLIVYDPKSCETADLGKSPCVGPVGEDETVGRIYIAKVNKDESGTWVVTDLKWRSSE